MTKGTQEMTKELNHWVATQVGGVPLVRPPGDGWDNTGATRRYFEDRYHGVFSSGQPPLSQVEFDFCDTAAALMDAWGARDVAWEVAQRTGVHEDEADEAMVDAVWRHLNEKIWS
jgi:hypothetical protein